MELSPLCRMINDTTFPATQFERVANQILEYYEKGFKDPEQIKRGLARQRSERLDRVVDLLFSNLHHLDEYSDGILGGVPVGSVWVIGGSQHKVDTVFRHEDGRVMVVFGSTEDPNAFMYASDVDQFKACAVPSPGSVAVPVETPVPQMPPRDPLPDPAATVAPLGHSMEFPQQGPPMELPPQQQPEYQQTSIAPESWIPTQATVTPTPTPDEIARNAVEAVSNHQKASQQTTPFDSLGGPAPNQDATVVQNPEHPQ